MGGRSIYRWMTGLAGVAALAASSVGFAQNNSVTTVSPLVVQPLAPIPEVGKGATYFSAEDLAQAAHQAHEDGIETRGYHNDCLLTRDSVKVRGVTRSYPPHREEDGDFDTEALWNTEANANFALQRAAEAAGLATGAAVDARRNAVLGTGKPSEVEATELARQTAVAAFQAAQAAAREAHLRLIDLETLASEYVGGEAWSMQALAEGAYNPCNKLYPWTDTHVGACAAQTMRQFQTQVDERSRRRAENGGQQDIYVPDEFRDLRLVGVQAAELGEAEHKVLHVTGKIVNTRAQTLAYPPLWVSAVDRFGTALATRQMTTSGGPARIPPAATVPFAFDLAPAPEKTARATVTFAPFAHDATQLPAGAFCTGAGRPPPPGGR